MGSRGNRPIGVTAVATLLVTLGAQVVAAALLALCSDISFLATSAGLRFEAMMLGFVFAGMSFAGFGIGLYEGYTWARPASLSVLAFVATLQVFSISQSGLPSGMVSVSGGLLALTGVSVVYLSLPKAKRFCQPIKKAFEGQLVREPAVSELETVAS